MACTPGLPQNSDFVLLRGEHRRLPLCVPAAVVGGVRRWQELQGVLLGDKRGLMLGGVISTVTLLAG